MDYYIIYAELCLERNKILRIYSFNIVLSKLHGNFFLYSIVLSSTAFDTLDDDDMSMAIKKYKAIIDDDNDNSTVMQNGTNNDIDDEDDDDNHHHTIINYHQR